MLIQESLKGGGGGGGGGVIARINLGGLGTSCRVFYAMRQLLMQSEA